MKKFFAVMSLVGMTVASSGAFAAGSMAQLTSTNGKVLVNIGEAFALPTSMMDLKVGDKVLVGDKSSASVSFNAGCTVDIAAGTVYTVASTAPCAKGQTSALVKGNIVSPAADLAPAGAGFPFFSNPLFLVGSAVVVGGTAWFVIDQLNDGGSN